ncbi:hypothetical protein K437DRAFT_255940 [Tilletiaria anomala UBC 951]|uniref:Uncharacterized protein n=1 Tax=Tilletiaria anomala (strain ATCC 24038 / CBS 436.72 / UBC 951) TaxID=1037660 RepID=A0A066W3L5_TILAU|nr:uncharacterized protein K437DRAFT_255940 [Tilletiaria anomala UBC 951]KDN47148.1 hypothetical protein K437DRAFT_255940 [Tilletiaria anomala UBC 951]
MATAVLLIPTALLLTTCLPITCLPIIFPQAILLLETHPLAAHLPTVRLPRALHLYPTQAR